MLTTFSGVGKTTRINRIFGNDGKAVMVAVNHGLGLGPVEGIENMERTLGQIMEGGPDSLTIHKGIAMHYTDLFAGRTALVLKCTNATRYRSPEETAIATVEEAVTLGADAIAVGLTLCSKELLLLRRRDSMASRPLHTAIQAAAYLTTVNGTA